MWVGLVFRLLEGSTVPSAFVCPTQEVSPVTLVIYSQPSTGQCSYCAAWRNLYALEKNRTKTYSAIWSLLCFDPSWTRPFFPIFYSLHLGVKGNSITLSSHNILSVLVKVCESPSVKSPNLVDVYVAPLKVMCMQWRSRHRYIQY